MPGHQIAFVHAGRDRGVDLVFGGNAQQLVLNAGFEMKGVLVTCLVATLDFAGWAKVSHEIVEMETLASVVECAEIAGWQHIILDIGRVDPLGRRYAPGVLGVAELRAGLGDAAGEGGRFHVDVELAVDVGHGRLEAGEAHLGHHLAETVDKHHPVEAALERGRQSRQRYRPGVEVAPPPVGTGARPCAQRCSPRYPAGPGPGLGASVAAPPAPCP